MNRYNILGIDASTVGSGGAKRHLVELLKAFDSSIHFFSIIKVWGSQEIMDQLPERSNILYYSHPFLNRGFIFRTIWQIFYRDESFKNQFDILLSPFGTYFGNERPYVSMSRNMLLFNTEERGRFGWSWIRVKMKILRFVQKKSFKNSQGIIFLSQYAEQIIKGQVNLNNVPTKIIHHGVSQVFHSEPKCQLDIFSFSEERPYVLLYISAVWSYKHHWNVVEAVANLYERGFPVELKIVGQPQQRSASKRLRKSMNGRDPDGRFISWFMGTGLNEVADFYKEADGFIFASTCENMPNILIEAMSSGLPIACSEASPMPEFLKDAGVYFDPTNVDNIEKVLEEFLRNRDKRINISRNSFLLSKKYSWEACANQTFSFLNDISNACARK